MNMPVGYKKELNRNGWYSLYFVSDTNKTENEGITRIVCERVVMDKQVRTCGNGQTNKYVLEGYRLVEAASEWASYEQVFIQVIHACTRSTAFLDRARFSKCRLCSCLCNDAPMLSSVRHYTDSLF